MRGVTPINLLSGFFLHMGEGEQVNKQKAVGQQLLGLQNWDRPSALATSFLHCEVISSCPPPPADETGSGGNPEWVRGRAGGGEGSC